jgi:isopenicillin N synthase-like dioxygenase
MTDSKKDHGVHATNREYQRYDQVEKRQEYALAEGFLPELFDDDYEIRTVDLARFLHGTPSDKLAFAHDLGSALQEIGFAILVGHGIDPVLHERAERELLRLFTGHSLAEKLRFAARRHGSINQGYFPIRETSDIHPDLVEGWVFCRRAFDLGERPPRLEDFWPDPTAEPAFRALCLAQEELILPVMQSLLAHLGCDPHLYDRRLAKTNFGLRLNYYPPIGEAEDRSGAGRLLGHEDTDLFTFLPAPKSEGLQVLNRKNLRWIRLDAPPGSIILNTGDYMQRITNDILPSTTHRVSKPRDPLWRGRARVSFPMNVYLWENELLEVLPGLPDHARPKYEPVSAIRFHTRTTEKYYGDGYAVEDPREGAS